MTPTKLIFDTDIGGDCDDAGALALIHRLCDRGEAELLLVTHCFNSPYYAGCIDAINTFFGRKVPIGVNYSHPVSKNPEGVYAKILTEECPNSYPASTYKTSLGAEDSLAALRKALRDADDGSITLVATGTLANMARLVLSEADEVCPLSGRELIKRKIKRTVVMGGRFFESWPMTVFESGDPTHHVITWEYNIRGSGFTDASTVFDNWEGELVLSSYEIGSYITTMRGYGKRAKSGDPVALAYKVHNGDVGRCSWDHTAVLEAVRPGIYWNLHKFGKISVDTDMITHWKKDSKYRHSYLLPKVDYEEIREVIDTLVMPKSAK